MYQSQSDKERFCRHYTVKREHALPVKIMATTSVKQTRAEIPASPGSRLARLKMLLCNRDYRASPASRANTFSSLNSASEQNDSPEDRYFSFYITHNGLSDHRAT